MTNTITRTLATTAVCLVGIIPIKQASADDFCFVTPDGNRVPLSGITCQLEYENGDAVTRCSAIGTEGGLAWTDRTFGDAFTVGNRRGRYRYEPTIVSCTTGEPL